MPSGKIFVLGLSRTGTTSLHAAMILLGHGSVHYPGHSARHWLAGNFRKDTLTDFDACMDLPTPVYYPQLDQRYPGSKFILLEREVDAWLDSVKRQWQTAGKSSSKTFLRDMNRVAVYGTTQFNAERLRYVYETHVANTKAYFNKRPQDFISMDVTSGDGWEILCHFIGLAPPPDITDFPRLRTPYIGKLAAVRNDETALKRKDILALVEGKAGSKFRQVPEPPTEKSREPG